MSDSEKHPGFGANEDVNDNTEFRETPKVARVRSKKKLHGETPIIGWQEWVCLPDLKIDAIKAKIDTGARTSALHAFKIHPFSDGGLAYVRFAVHPVQRHRIPEIECVARVVDERIVTSSNGQKQKRFVIQTPITIGQMVWEIELTLTNRDEMGFRMLLGREALRKRFFVNPGRSFVMSTKHPATKSTMPPERRLK